MSCSSIGGDHFTSHASLLDTQVPSQRRVALPTANSTFAVGVGTPGALANSSLSSGWQVGETHCPPLSVCSPGTQVWGGPTPSPQRNVSASSAPASSDPLSSQGEMPFRSNVAEGWRSNSGTWADDDAGEFALVGILERGRRNCWPRVHFPKYANISTRAGQDRSASRKV
jgi:hypothetical protein